MDDIFVIHKAEHSASLLHHINSQNPHIQLTVEEPNQHGSLPFLDNLVSPGPNNAFIITVYRKPTHTDQYLHWDSNHYIGAKLSVYNTLGHRAKIVSHDQQALQQELNHIKTALQASHFSKATLNRLQQRFGQQHQTYISSNSRDNLPTTTINTNNNNTSRNISGVVPYIQGLGERFKKTFKTRAYKCTIEEPTQSNTSNGPKRQGPQALEKWHYLELQVPTHKLYRPIHRGIWQNTRKQVEGTSQGSLPYTSTHQHHRTPHQSRLFQHNS